MDIYYLLLYKYIEVNMIKSFIDYISYFLNKIDIGVVYIIMDNNKISIYESYYKVII